MINHLYFKKADPATILLNGGAFLTVPSGASQDISLIDQDGVDIVPYSVVSDVITVDRAKWLYLATGSSAAANLVIRTKTGEQFVVDWGQGSDTTTANNVTTTKTYSPNFVGLVKVKPLTSSINALDGIYSTSGVWAFDLSDLKEQVPNLTFRVYFQGNLMTLSGDIANLPSGLTYEVYFSGSLITLSGDIVNLPSGLTYRVYFVGNLMTLTGDIANLPSGLTYEVVFTGNLMTLSGDIVNLPSGLTYRVYFSGNLMTLSGDIANLPSSLTYQVYFSGNLMTLSGDIAAVPANITYLYLDTTSSTYTYTSGRVWKNMSMVFIRPAVGYMTATEVDNIFIDLDNSPLNTGAGTHDLRGNCAAPTAASLPARNSLVSKGKTVLHN